MSAKQKRFDYIKDESIENAQEPQTPVNENQTQSVPRGQGRMQQDREQLNVRLPKMLKRRAMAKAALEGRTIGEVIEELLQHYSSDVSL